MTELEQKSTYTLQEVGEKPISFILTYTSSYIVNSDNSGNIIVYAEHDGNPVTYNDAYSETYNDLYVGDEHIAGGFGFRNTIERSYAYDAIWSRLPDAESAIKDLQDQAQLGYSEENSLIVNPTYSYITTENGIYQLKYDFPTNELRIDCDHKDSIIYSNVNIKNANSIENNSRIYSITDNINLSSLIFTTSSNSNITGVYFSYSLSENNVNELYKSTSNPYILGTNDGYLNSELVSSSIDPNIKPNVTETKWRIYFDNDLFNKDILKPFVEEVLKKYSNQSVKIYINAIIENKVVSYNFLTIRYLLPIYYCYSKEMPSSFNSFVFTNDYDEQLTLKFLNDISDPTFNYVLIPKEFNDIEFLFIKTNVYVEWEKITNFFGKSTHTAYKSPNKYGDTTNWTIIIKDKI